MRRILYTLISVFPVALFCSSIVHAAPKKVTTKPGSFISLTPTVGGLLFSASESDSRSLTPLYGLKLSYDKFGTGITNTIGVEGTFNYFTYKTEPAAEDATGYLLRADAIYSFSMSKTMVPFLAAGMGGMLVEKESGRKTDPFLNYGLGVKYFLEEYLALRVDARQLFLYSEVSTRNNFELSAGLTYVFGKERKKPVTPDVKKEEVPQFKMKQVDATPPPPVALDPALEYLFMDQLGATGPAIIGITSVPSAFPPSPSPLPPPEQRPEALAYVPAPPPVAKKQVPAPPPPAAPVVPVTPPAPVAPPVPVPVAPPAAAPAPVVRDEGVPIRPQRAMVRKKVLEFVVEFDFAKHQIRPADLIRVKKAAEEIMKAKDAIVTIEGHTDIVGKHAPNQSLSIRRATSVKNELVKHGVDRRKVVIRGHSYDRPADTNKTEQGRQKNRRATTVVIALIETE